MDWIWYIIIAWYIAITFWAILMWIDKMAKVIIWNYLAWITCFAFWNLIHQRINQLMASPDSVFIWISYSKFADFLSAWQLTFILLLFICLIWIIYACWRIQVSFSSHSSTEKLYFVILIPLTVFSFIIGPYIALKADWIRVLGAIESTLTKTFWFLVEFINHIPFWMFITWITFIIISSQIKFKISLSAKTTKLPDGM
jgi:hypothetical protein